MNVLLIELSHPDNPANVARGMVFGGRRLVTCVQPAAGRYEIAGATHRTRPEAADAVRRWIRFREQVGYRLVSPPLEAIGDQGRFAELAAGEAGGWLDGDELNLTITGPGPAAEAARSLFEHWWTDLRAGAVTP